MIDPKVIRFVDCAVNFLIVLCFLPLLLYGLYAVWDSQQVYQNADSVVYETYKPSSKDDLTFEELQKINSEVFGWIQIYDTHIDYPLVRTTNNSKYVNTDAKGEFSLSGSIFLDCKNKKDFSDMNSILYRHNMEKKAMFGELQSFAEEKYFEKHQYGGIFYGYKWHEIEFFAFLHADAYDSVIYNTAFQNTVDQEKYLSYIKQHADIFKELSFDQDEHFIALSTCTTTSTNGRHILVGRIIDQASDKSFDRQRNSAGE